MSWLAKRACRLAIILGALAAAAPLQAQAPDVALRGHGGPVRALAVLPDGRLASGGFDSSIIVWDLNRGQAAHVLRQHETAVNALVARPDGCLVSGGEDARIRLWCETAAPALSTLTGHQGAVSALAISAGGLLVSGSWDKSVRVWDAAGASRTIAEHVGPVTSVLFTTDGTVLSTSHDGMVKLTPVQAVPGGPQPRSITLEAPVTSAAQLPDGRFLLACADGSLRAADAQLSAVRTIAQLEGALTAVVVSRDGKTAATGGLRTPTTLIDLTSDAANPAPLGKALPFWAMVFSTDGREIFTGGNDRAVRRFDAVTGAAVDPTIPKTASPDIADSKDRGAKVFRACSVCHGLAAADTHLAGPTLHRIMGRRIASLGGYQFSQPLMKLDIVWTPETIARLFDVGPAVFTPGTKMPEQRITDPADRQALVEWLARVTTP